MAEAANHPRAIDRAASWTLILGVALGLRAVAAVVVWWYVGRKGTPCVFADTAIYLELARTIVAGEPYAVSQWGVPHYALRTPGYPLFLAACREVFGESLLAARLVQAVLGTVAVWLVAKLTSSVVRGGREDAPDAVRVDPSPARGEGVREEGHADLSVSPLPPGEGPGVRDVASSPALGIGPFESHSTGDAPHPGPLPEGEGGRGAPGSHWVPLAAASLAAVHPYIVGMSALLLSEATFLPLMLLGLWGLASLWRGPGPGRPMLVAIGTGLAMGAAILSRPSWALFVPMVLAAWVLGVGRGGHWVATRRALVVSLATAAILAPWWVRNGRIFGRFVPTALWVGASLLDGIGPQATGASDMEFVNAPDVRSLGEVEQDSVFRARSVAFARDNPGRVLALAMIKLGRFWSPWPNADTLQAPGAALASSLVTVPVFVLMALGAWDRRRDFRALVLLAGPLVYFCALHMVFVSSIRYRIPGEVPAIGLAAVGLGRALAWARPAVSDEPPGRGGIDR